MSTTAPRTGWQTARLVVAVLLLLATTWLGLKEGYDGLTGAETMWQRIAAGSQLIYGLGAVASLAGLYLRASWVRFPLIVWALMLGVTGGLSPVVWGDAPWTAGLVSGGATALTAALIVWMALSSIKEPK